MDVVCSICIGKQLDFPTNPPFFPGLIIWQGLGLYNTCGDLGRKIGNM